MLVENGRPVAAGPRELRSLLRAAGWHGEDLVLLTQPPAACWEATLAHAQSLADSLTADIWFASAGADVWIQPDGRLAAATPGGAARAWHVVTFARQGDFTGDEEVALPRALAATTRSGPVTPRPTSLVARPASAEIVVSGSTPLNPPAVAGNPPAVIEPDEVLQPVGVTVARVLGKGSPHGVPWLPDAPVVNRRALDLYLWTPLAADEIEAWGLPSADLFLLAGQDPLRLSERRRTGYLLRVYAPAETAVELDEHLREAPADLRQRLAATGATHVLPVAWLSELRVTGRFDLDARGGITSRSDVDAAALAIRFEGAEHGVPGLPNEVVNWPDRASAAGTAAYLMLPDTEAATAHAVHHGYVPLSRRKPTLLEGHRLLEVKVRKRRAVDVPATLDSLDGMPIVGRMHDFVGLDLLLPEEDLPRAVVSKVWRFGPTGKVTVDKLTSATLAEVLAEPYGVAA